nr:hypothetical protein [uncultured bacterium]
MDIEGILNVLAVVAAIDQEEFDRIFDITVNVLRVAAYLPYVVVAYKIFQRMTYRKTEAEIVKSVTVGRRRSSDDIDLCRVTYAYMFKGIRYEKTIETTEPSGVIRHSRIIPTRIYDGLWLRIGIFLAVLASMALFVDYQIRH